MPTKNTQSLEKKLDGLKQIVEQLEQGELSLEDSLKQFEQGVKLAQQCQQTLENAEQKVQILLKKTLNDKPDAFNDESNLD